MKIHRPKREDGYSPSQILLCSPLSLHYWILRWFSFRDTACALMQYVSHGQIAIEIVFCFMSAKPYRSALQTKRCIFAYVFSKIRQNLTLSLTHTHADMCMCKSDTWLQPIYSEWGWIYDYGKGAENLHVRCCEHVALPIQVWSQT